MPDPDWLPPLLRMPDYGGVWSRYVEAVYAVFRRDFIESQPKFQGCWVRVRRDPLEQGKEAGFWHCTSGGEDEAQRKPELRRMERIEWVRAIIEHSGDPTVGCWVRMHGSEARRHLWFREEFLVVLGERKRLRGGRRYFQLITAFDTPQEHQKRKRRRQRDEWRSRNG